ncbi:UDP-N-acetylmuramoyl-L-alanine--D-glutamate ligase [Neorickettsia helminthoeca]|nr:UDP-N-acetylmuramoyl-L-alanine--D-glutamate ligase [Neorickettsia helminthoeca]
MCDVLIVGMGRTGKSLLSFFAARGAKKILVFDDKEKSADFGYPQIVEHVDHKNLDWKKVRNVFVSPGIPIKYPFCHEIVSFAIQNGCKLTNDVQFFLDLLEGKIAVGITGTNGKSTTTAMISHILGNNFISVGNIGRPVMEHINDGVGYIIELSSYQLEMCSDLPLSSAVLLDITPDHMDRYASLDDYVKAKVRIFDNLETTAIVALNSCVNKRIFSELSNRRKIGMSVTEMLNQGFSMIGNTIYENSREILTIPRSVVQFQENLLAAFVCTRLYNISEEEFFRKIISFKSLPHRTEKCGSYKNVTFVNDSKATNIESLQKAISLYSGSNLYLLAGGREKHKNAVGDSESLKGVKKAYFFGEAAQNFAMAQSGSLEYKVFRRFKDAFLGSVSDALASSDEIVILLSPGCSSFDEFKNFEERGDYFKGMVRSLLGQPH